MSKDNNKVIMGTKSGWVYSSCFFILAHMFSVDFVSKRTILWYLVFLGFAVNYMIRININIAIVAMVKKPNRTREVHLSECLTFSNETSNRLNNTELTSNFSSLDEENTFLWNEKEQGSVLGAFYWLNWVTQVPGGVLAQRYGTKTVFGLSQFFTCVLSFIIPWSAYYHINFLLFVRALQGVIQGLTWPAMHSMTAKWIPPNERSKFVTAYLGSSVGAALTFPMCGLIIDFINWEAVFHVSGAIGVLWFIAWWCLVFDTPAEHPRISNEEKCYIENSLGKSLTKEKLKTPWKEILLSTPVWMNILAQWGGIWGLFTLLTQSPTYFKHIHGWDIRMTGFLSGLPHLLRMLFALLFSYLGDYLLRQNKMSRTGVRKLATAVCLLGQAAFTLALALAGCDSTAAIVYLTAATAIHGAVSTGPLASFVDLSPNFASITLGLSGMITVMPGFISPAIVGFLTYNNQTIKQWQIVFFISFAMLFVPGVLNLIYGKSEIQKWNDPEAEELQQLDRKKTNP